MTAENPSPSIRPEVWEDLADVMASVPAQADILPIVAKRVRPQVAERFRDGAPGVERIFVVGCGDSFFTGYAAQLLLERLTGIEVTASESMEFARYRAPFLRRGSLVLPISNGGGVMRTVEAAEVAMQAGAQVVLITARPDSPFGRLGAPLIDQYAEAPSVGGLINALGLVNYMASFITLAEIGLRIGEARGVISPAQVSVERARLDAIPGHIRDIYEREIGRIRDLARETVPFRNLFILGAGPSYGTALFAAAKFYEAPNIAAVAQQLEDWAHEQFFTLRPGQAVLVFAPRGLGGRRAVEILEGIRDLGGRSLVVGDDEEALKLAAVAFRMPEVGEDLSPLCYVIPAEILAIAYQEIQGKLDMPDASLREIQHAVSRRQIGGSERVTLAELATLTRSPRRRVVPAE